VVGGLEGDLGDVAVLGRTWRELRQVAAALKRERIPHRFYGGTWDPWERSTDGRMLARCLLMTLNPSDDNLAALVATWGGSAAAKSLGRLRVSAARNRRRLYDELTATDPRWGAQSKALTGLWIERRSMLEVGHLEIEDLPAMEVARLFVHNFQGGMASRELLELVESLEGRTLGQWRDWWLFGRQDQDRIQEGGGKVHLLTVHAAKGLEWPVVIGIGCDDQQYPRPGSKPEDVAEDRRVLYVLVTRARDRLVLVRSVSKGWSRFLRGVTR